MDTQPIVFGHTDGSEEIARAELYGLLAQLWLAPELGYLPVRIRITQANGDFAELNLRAHGVP